MEQVDKVGCRRQPEVVLSITRSGGTSMTVAHVTAGVLRTATREVTRALKEYVALGGLNGDAVGDALVAASVVLARLEEEGLDPAFVLDYGNALLSACCYREVRCRGFRVGRRGAEMHCACGRFFPLAAGSVVVRPFVFADGGVA